MWLMSQKQGLWPERSADIDEGTETDASAHSRSSAGRESRLRPILVVTACSLSA